MATYLVILDAKHALSTRLGKLITSLGGKKYYRLTTQEVSRRFTQPLFNRLPGNLQLLFLPKKVKALPITLVSIPGYPRPAYLVVSKFSFLPSDLTRMIGGYLTLPEVKTFGLTSKEVRKEMIPVIEERQQQYHVEWQKLVDQYGDKVIGPEVEFSTTLQDPIDRAQTYRQYAEAIASPNEYPVTVLGKLPPSRVARFVVAFGNFHAGIEIDEEELNSDPYIRGVADWNILPSEGELNPDICRMELEPILLAALKEKNDELALWLAHLCNNILPITLVLHGRRDLADRLLDMENNRYQQRGFSIEWDTLRYNAGETLTGEKALSLLQGIRLGDWMIERLGGRFSDKTEVAAINQRYPELGDYLANKGKIFSSFQSR